jgi:hypothetical protein
MRINVGFGLTHAFLLLLLLEKRLKLRKPRAARTSAAAVVSATARVPTTPQISTTHIMTIEVPRAIFIATPRQPGLAGSAGPMMLLPEPLFPAATHAWQASKGNDVS